MRYPAVRDWVFLVTVLVLNHGQYLAADPGGSGVDRFEEEHTHFQVVHRGRVKRTAVWSDDNLWTDWVVPYTYDDDITTSDIFVEAIQESIEHIEEKTCVRFRLLNKTEADNYIGNFVRIIRGSGCQSSVGKMGEPRAQALSISTGCAYPDTIIHELGHLLGLWHEHARYDRDNNIVILWKNVQYKHNFEKVKRMRLLAPYDLSSMMHYGTKNYERSDRAAKFGKECDHYEECVTDGYTNMHKTLSPNGQPTFYPVDERMAFVIGYRRDLSFYDAYTLNQLYKCGDHCGHGSNVCENQGYLDQRCQCVCPPGIEGDICQQVRASKPESCGGVIDVKKMRYVTSPRYPRNYTKNIKCNWLLRSRAGTMLRLEFVRVPGQDEVEFDIERSTSGLCKDGLEIRYHHIGVDRGPVFCGVGFDGTITSISNYMMLSFYTNSRYNRKGFKAAVTVLPKQDCSSLPCLNGGLCTDISEIDTYFCNCTSSFVGRNCEIEIVDGGWSVWKKWSKCIGTCGRRFRSRVCNNPEPQNGGEDCNGPLQQMASCGNPASCRAGFSCDFGNKSHPASCGIVQESVSDTMDWQEIAGATPSMNTGPNVGHTSGGSSDIYLYLEASAGKAYDTAEFWLPKSTWKPGIYCMQFFYHMRGGGVGSLQVRRRTKTSPFSITTWQHSGEQGDDWNEANIDVFLYVGVKLGFVAVKGDSYESDIALDDISVSPGKCNWPQPKPHGCRDGKRKYPPGYFHKLQGCNQKYCFCNHDGHIDCPNWMEENICDIFGAFQPSELKRKQRNIYRFLAVSIKGNKVASKTTWTTKPPRPTNSNDRLPTGTFPPDNRIPVYPHDLTDEDSIDTNAPPPIKQDPPKSLPSTGWKPIGSVKG